jgi:hypothetical protein
MKRSCVSLLVGIGILLLVSCRSAPTTTQRTAEEVTFGEEAVKQMLVLIGTGASTTLYDEGRWDGGNAELLPPDADHLIRQQEQIPGITRLLELYRNEANLAVATVAREIPQYLESQLLDQLDISDPYAIIEGEADAATRFFSSTAASDLEQFLVERLQGDAGDEAAAAWNMLLETYHTYVIAQQQVKEETELAKITEPFYRMVSISMIRTFISAMSAQESLIRTMAPAYDDPRIALFATP